MRSSKLASGSLGLVLVALLLVMGSSPSLSVAGPEGLALPVDPRQGAQTFTSPNGDYEVVLPANWTVQSTSPEAAYFVLEGATVGMSIVPRPWCGPSDSLADALTALQEDLDIYSNYTQFQALAGPRVRTIGGSAAADLFFRHTLADGPQYQVAARILGSAWSRSWRFIGATNLTEIGRMAEINATLDSFVSLPAPPLERFVQPGGDFAFSVPHGWTAVTVGSRASMTSDFLALGASIVVTGEARTVQGTSAESRAILQEALDGLSAEPGFQVLEGPRDLTVDGHVAAAAFVTWSPSTYDVNEEIVVVLGPEWGRFWAILGMMYSWDTTSVRTCVDATVASFDILPPPAGRDLATAILGLSNWILIGGLLATAAEGTFFAIQVVRQTRRRGP